jgi:hypothetical protein
LYAFGGRLDQARRLKTCEVYDPSTNVWRYIEPMNRNHSDAAIGVINGDYLIIIFKYTDQFLQFNIYRADLCDWWI